MRFGGELRAVPGSNVVPRALLVANANEDALATQFEEIRTRDVLVRIDPRHVARKEVALAFQGAS